MIKYCSLQLLSSSYRPTVASKLVTDAARLPKSKHCGHAWPSASKQVPLLGGTRCLVELPKPEPSQDAMSTKASTGSSTGSYTSNALLDVAHLSLPSYPLDTSSPVRIALCKLHNPNSHIYLMISYLAEHPYRLTCNPLLKPLHTAPPNSSPSPPKPSSHPSTASPHPPPAHLPPKAPPAAAAP